MNFQAVLLQPHKKSATKRLREVLNSVFRHLDEVAAASILDVGITEAHVSLFSKGYMWQWGNCTGQDVWPRPIFVVVPQASVEIPGLQLSNQDYFPYVYFHIDLSLLD